MYHRAQGCELELGARPAGGGVAKWQVVLHQPKHSYNAPVEKPERHPMTFTFAPTRLLKMVTAVHPKVPIARLRDSLFKALEFDCSASNTYRARAWLLEDSRDEHAQQSRQIPAFLARPGAGFSSACGMPFRCLTAGTRS